MKVRVVTVGLGYWGPKLVKSFSSHPNVELVALVETSAERRQLVKAELPDIPTYQSLEECFGSSTCDAVAIATPTRTHHRLGMQALLAGKHLFMEKPLSHDSATAFELIEAARTRSLVLMTGHICLYNNGLLELRRLAASGVVGKLLHVRSVRTNRGPIRCDVNVLWDLASHDISFFNYLFDALPIRVSCCNSSPLGLKQAAISQGTLCYPRNVVATFYTSWLSPQKIRETTVVGDSKILVFDDMKPTTSIQLFDSDIRFSSVLPFSSSFQDLNLAVNQDSAQSVAITAVEPLKNECHEFIDCILEKRTPLSDGVNGLEVIKILEALETSASEGGAPVNIWNLAEQTARLALNL